MGKQQIDGAQIANLALGAIGIYGAYKFYRLVEGDSATGAGGGGNTPPLIDPSVDVPDADAPTLSRQAARLKADAIFAAIYGDGSFWGGQSGEDEDAVIYALTQQVETDGDVLLIADEYGAREGAWSTQGPLDLAATLVRYLSVANRQAINLYYARHNINIAF